MNTSIRTRIIKIGNSQGIRIPKPLLEQSGIGENVEIEVKEGQLILTAVANVRVGWDAAFTEMSQQGDDRLLDTPENAEWDDQEWEW